MPSLLIQDDDTGTMPPQGADTDLLGIAPVLRISQPNANAPDAGEGLAGLYNQVSDYLARQQAEAAKAGLWEGGGLLEGGHPTSKGLTDAAKQYGQGVLMGTTAPGEGAGITAFHGSPYDFDAFDASKIGTGEGAQAYGHGLYFAESPGVAKSYRDNLSSDISHPQGSPEYHAQNALYDAGGDAAGAAEKLAAQATAARDAGASDADVAALRQAHSIMANEPHRIAGRMYEVNINADPQHFLDWDAPLSEQHPKVQDAVKQAGFVDPAPKIEWVGDKNGWELQQNGQPTGTSLDTTGNRSYNQYSDGKFVGEIPAASLDQWKDILAQSHRDAWRDPDPTGRDIIKNNTRAQPEKQLQSAGIPGIKYLDQGSRGSGQGTRNYVVFDPSIIDIAKKYAVPAAVLSGTGAGLVQGNQNQ